MAKDRAAPIAYILIAGLLVLLAYPALVWLVRSWLSNPYYSHGFLILPLSGVFAWRQWRRLVGEPRQARAWPGLLLTVAALAGVVWAMHWQNYALASLALLAAGGGVLLYLEGWPRLRHWLFPLAFLALAIPLPLIDRASPWLESFTAGAAAGLARLVGIPAVQRGGEISLPGTTLLVGAPCSGLRSLVALATAGVLWVYLVRGRPAAKAALLAAIVPLAALANVLRIAILLVLAATAGEEIALAYYHDISSPLLFVAAVGLWILVGKALGCSRIRDDIL